MEISKSQLDIWVRISNLNHRRRKAPQLKAGGVELAVAKGYSPGAVNSLGCCLLTLLGKTWRLFCFSKSESLPGIPDVFT